MILHANCLQDNLHGMSKTVFWDKCKEMSSAENVSQRANR